MQTPIIYTIWNKIVRRIRILTGHTYGCCDHWFMRCSTCIYVKGESTMTAQEFNRKQTDNQIALLRGPEPTNQDEKDI